jgi:hypothetical protein
MGFKDKLIKQTKTTAQRVANQTSSNPEAPREYYPKSIGIYCEDNPKEDRRAIRPHVIGKNPPTHKTLNILYKDKAFNTTPCWYGKLYAEPIIVNMGYFPPYALYKDTDDRIFPNNSNDFDKKLPIIKGLPLNIPLQYDLLTPIPNERKRLSDILKKNLSDAGRKRVEADLAALEGMKDDEKIRTTHDVKIIPKIFIPVMMMIETEVQNEEGEFVKELDPKLVIFEETLGIKKTKALVANKLIDSADDIEGALDYLYGDISDATAVGQPIQIFRNSMASEGKDSLSPICVRLYDDKIPKSLLPYFDIAEMPNVDDESLLRIIVLEMIQLFAPKGDTASIEGQIKEYFWSQVQKKEDKN